MANITDLRSVQVNKTRQIHTYLLRKLANYEFFKGFHCYEFWKNLQQFLVEYFAIHLSGMLK